MAFKLVRQIPAEIPGCSALESASLKSTVSITASVLRECLFLPPWNIPQIGNTVAFILMLKQRLVSAAPIPENPTVYFLSHNC
jgi:hypothetical protein